MKGRAVTDQDNGDRIDLVPGEKLQPQAQDALAEMNRLLDQFDKETGRE